MKEHILMKYGKPYVHKRKPILKRLEERGKELRDA